MSQRTLRVAFIVAGLLVTFNFLIQSIEKSRPTRDVGFVAKGVASQPIRSVAVVGIVTVPGNAASFAVYQTAFVIGTDPNDQHRHYLLSVDQGHLDGSSYYVRFHPMDAVSPTVCPGYILKRSSGLMLLAVRMPADTAIPALSIRRRLDPAASLPVMTIGYARDRIWEHVTAARIRSTSNQWILRDRVPFDPLGTFRGAPLLDERHHVIGICARCRSPPICKDTADIVEFLRIDYPFLISDF